MASSETERSLEELLAVSELFGQLPPDGRHFVSRGGIWRTLSADEVLIRQGEPSDRLFLILSGSLLVARAHPHMREFLVLGELGAGEVAGETGMLHAEPRSVTVITKCETKVLEVSADLVRATIVRYPEVASGMLRILSRRLVTAVEIAEHYSQCRKEQRCQHGMRE